MSPQVTMYPGSAHPVPGFLVATTAAGIRKSGKNDVALIYAPQGANGSAIFTQSEVVAAPVLVSRSHLAQGSPSCLIVNAGNANACTGADGLQVARQTADDLAHLLGIKPHQIIIASTGVIGVPLPYTLLQSSFESLVTNLESSEKAWGEVARAIMTTDLVPKMCSASVSYKNKTYTITGVAKGSGMIRPNMATMIGCLVTDAPLGQAQCESMVSEVAHTTFNRVTVDGDTSTNDTLVLMTSGTDAPHDDPVLYQAIMGAMEAVSAHLARAIAGDGEGATKLVTIDVCGAPSEEDAEKVAFTIAESPLVKTALFGNDANWGRVAGAAGRAGVSFDQNKLSITFAGIEVCHNGTALPFDEDRAYQALNQPEVSIVVDLGHVPGGCATVWTCDLSYEYVRINGEYRS